MIAGSLSRLQISGIQNASLTYSPPVWPAMTAWQCLKDGPNVIPVTDRASDLCVRLRPPLPHPQIADQQCQKKPLSGGKTSALRTFIRCDIRRVRRQHMPRINAGSIGIRSRGGTGRSFKIRSSTSDTTMQSALSFNR